MIMFFIVNLSPFIRECEIFIAEKILNKNIDNEYISKWICSFSIRHIWGLFCFLVFFIKSLYKNIDELFLPYTFYVFGTVALCGIFMGGNSFSGYYYAWEWGDFSFPIIYSYTHQTLMESNYPPLATFLYKIIGYFYGTESSVYKESFIMSMFILFFGVALNMIFEEFLKDKKYKRFFSISLFFTTPVWLCLARANIIIIAFVFTCVFVLLINNENKYYRHLALLSLAIAANIKLYPAIFGLILVKNKRWKESFICAFEGFIIFLIPYLYEIMYSGIRLNLGILAFASSDLSYGENLSIKSLVYQILIGNSDYSTIDHVSNISTLVFCFLMIILFFKTKRLDHEYLILSLLCIQTPTVSFAYSLIFLIIPFMMFIQRKKDYTYTDYIEYIIYMLLFILIYSGFPIIHPHKQWRLIILWVILIVTTIRDNKKGKYNIRNDNTLR